jgi:eukaryotic-like serine/threonine-protein kinase
MAEVFLARQSGLDGFEKLVVIKRILPHISQDEEFVTMFLDEARTAADLRHPNVVNIFEVGEAEGTYFMAMEFLHGQDIRRIQRKSAGRAAEVPIQHASQLIIDAANGLHYAHTKQDLKGRPLSIIHRDVSPQNIIVSYDGSTKIVDFGIAKAASQDAHTATGVIKGKYTYMSPEQAQGEIIDHRSDQFALGIVFWELLTMRRLFKRPSEIATLNAIIDCHVPSPRSFAPKLPEHLEHIVMQCLARDPNDRFNTCEELVLELEDFLAAQGLVHSSARVGPWMRTLFADELDDEADLGVGQLDGESFASSALPKIEATSGGQRVGTKVERSKGRSRHDPVEIPADERGAPDAETLYVSSQSARDALVAMADAPEDDEDDNDGESDLTVPGDAVPFTEQGSAHHELSYFTDKGTGTSTPGINASRAATSWALPLVRRGRGSATLLVAGVAAAGVLVGGALLGLFLWFGLGSGPGQLTVRSTPAGARILLNGADTFEKTPHIFSKLASDRRHEVRLELAGYVAESATVVFGTPPVAEVALPLEPARDKPPERQPVVRGAVLGAAKPLSLPAAAPPPDKVARPATEKVEGKDEHWDAEVGSAAASAKQQRREPAAKAKPARLRIVAKPWATVSINGKPEGETPMPPLSLAPGTYEVRLVNAEVGKDIKRTIRLGPGDDELIRVEW